VGTSQRFLATTSRQEEYSRVGTSPPWCISAITVHISHTGARPTEGAHSKSTTFSVSHGAATGSGMAAGAVSSVGMQCVHSSLLPLGLQSQTHPRHHSALQAMNTPIIWDHSLRWCTRSGQTSCLWRMPFHAQSAHTTCAMLIQPKLNRVTHTRHPTFRTNPSGEDACALGEPLASTRQEQHR